MKSARLSALLMGALLAAPASAMVFPASTNCKPLADDVPYAQQKAISDKLSAALKNSATPPLELADAIVAELGAYRYIKDTTVQAYQQQLQAIWGDTPADAVLMNRLQEQGRSYFRRSRCNAAQPLLQTAYRMAGQLYGPDHALAMDALHDLLQLMLALDDINVGPQALRLLAYWDTHGVPAGAEPWPLQILAAQHLYKVAKLDDAEAVLKGALAGQKARAPQNAERLRQGMLELAAVHYAQLRYTDGEAVLAAAPVTPSSWPIGGKPNAMKTALADKVRAGDVKGALAYGMATLPALEADAAAQQAALDRAAGETGDRSGDKASEKSGENAAQALAAARRKLTSSQLQLAQQLEWIGELHHALGQLPEAEAMYDRALALYTRHRSRGNEHVEDALAVLYRMRGDYARALPLREKVLAAQLASGGETHPDVIESKAELARIRQRIGAADQTPVK